MVTSLGGCGNGLLPTAPYPLYMSVFITGEAQLKHWLTADIYQSLEQVCDKSAKKTESHSPVAELMKMLQLLKPMSKSN